MFSIKVEQKKEWSTVFVFCNGYPAGTLAVPNEDVEELVALFAPTKMINQNVGEVKDGGSVTGLSIANFME